MAYTLHPLAAGSYDLKLNGILVGGVVRNGQQRDWRAELLEELPPSDRPHPFVDLEHTFPNLESVMAWLGHAAVLRDG